MTEISWLPTKGILTKTSGFLHAGYTHTLNPYTGCTFAATMCGTFCYAQHNRWLTRGRPWGLYGAKDAIREAYRRDYDRLKRPRRGTPWPLKIYMSSSTDPYLPQETQLGLTRAVLEEMLERPPDVLVLQSHTTRIRRDFPLLRQLATRCVLWISLTVETDMKRLAGFPPHTSSPAARLSTLRSFRAAGMQTQATISPLLPLAHPEAFAHELDVACTRVILDHYLLGDGSTQGWRTKRPTFIQRLVAAGYAEWTTLAKFWEVRDVLVRVLGADRVLVSCDGFNAV
jgi:DNA repair photolyase